MMINQKAIGELCHRIKDREIGMQSVVVLLAMLECMDYENRVELGQKELAYQLGMDKGNFSRATKALLDHGFITRMGNRRGWYRLSPRICWKGTQANHNDALRREQSEIARNNLRVVA